MLVFALHCLLPSPCVSEELGERANSYELVQTAISKNTPLHNQEFLLSERLPALQSSPLIPYGADLYRLSEGDFALIEVRVRAGFLEATKNTPIGIEIMLRW